MQHYLTKWELYVLFVEYLRFQQVNFSPAVYCFKVRRQLATLREQPFFNTNPDTTKEEFEKISRIKKFKGTSLEHSNLGVYFRDRKIFAQWLESYLTAYQTDELHSRREQFCSHEQSMCHTLDLLKQYAKINSKKILLKDTLNDMAGNTIRANERVRLYEDILVLVQKECLTVDDVILNNPKILTDIGSKEETPLFSLRLTFLKPIEEIESFLRTTPVYTNLPAEEQPKTENIDTKKILEKLNVLEVKANFRNDDSEDDSNSYLGLRMENKKIYYENKTIPLPFREGSKEMKLVKYLIKQKTKPSHRDDLMDVIGLTAKKKKRKKFNMYDNDTTRGPQPNIRKRNLDKLRHIITVVSNKLSDVKLTIIKTEKRCILLQKLDK
ncbi:hypothetical protein [Candidatus Avelusimicrobium faecicola]|uniref:hypothetical protein n=1 Tax=Candidatus Avelusimicrobium faecicola TaxID=3416205 RepID=UPI003D0BE3AE